MSGFVIGGSTGEAPLLSDPELLALVEIASDVAEGRHRTVGVGAESTGRVIALARDAAERGADAVLVRSPCYYLPAMTPDALAEHFYRVADASPVPVLLYHIPRFVPVTMAPDLVGRLVEHGNIIGIKDSSGDRDHLTALVEACGSNACVWVGSGALLLEALGGGAVGGILGVALLATRAACGVYEAYRTGDEAAGSDLQGRVGPLHRAVVAGLGVPGVKAGLDRLGLRGGAPRPPLRPLTPDRIGTLEAALEAAGLNPSAVP